MVAWNTICRPASFGGLGVKNMKLQALALRVRWEWLSRVGKDRPWSNLAVMVDDEAREVFDSLVGIEVGRGDRVLFWRDRWIHGFRAQDIAPNIQEMVQTRVINSQRLSKLWRERGGSMT